MSCAHGRMLPLVIAVPASCVQLPQGAPSWWPTQEKIIFPPLQRSIATGPAIGLGPTKDGRLTLSLMRVRNILEEAAEKFKDVSEAYSVLSDDEQRRIYDRTLGIRKLNYPAQRWKDAARKAKAERPLYTAQPPPGFTPINEDVWKAWHYGVNATADDAIKQTDGGWMDLEPGNPHQEYFKRQREKESETLGVGRGHRYNSNREKIHLIERVRLRREVRLKREAGERSKTKAGREKEEEAAEICSIS